ncbi:patatin-like phospholipase family protein [Nonomuraea endophytica]|uniref:NTE family protein n=1 Tax=Nonomuraea endophytica TaxID=714136 RepID=A0A7W8A3N7_9ACTN|nr:patatin-like phospholipase family protein [Nonomuraea endophytica]MBB5078141.1 NTE family protein [Nonomuraea endophytica]
MRRALVLGPGGVAATAWLAGLITGLRREGVDLSAADLVVGTSAGAVAAALLATGAPLDTPPEGHADLLRDAEWPARRLLIAAVDASSGERAVFDIFGGVPLPAAVAASRADPAITIAGRRYTDAGSATNADLAKSADRVLVLEPLAPPTAPRFLAVPSTPATLSLSVALCPPSRPTRP